MITFVNVFTVEPDKQQTAIEAINRVYQEVVKHQPGFIQAKLLCSDDNTKITAIADWESKEHLQAMTETQGFRDLHSPEFYRAIVSVNSMVYTRVVEVRP